MTTHWLRYKESLCWTAFQKEGDQVRVLSLIGATRYIDKTMPCEEARQIWREQKARGYHKPSEAEIAAEQMTVQKLQIYIYN